MDDRPNDDRTFDERFDEWSSCVGPARLLLLHPLRSALSAESPFDIDRIRWAMEPLTWLIERAAVSGIPADELGTSREFTAIGNARFGWNPQPETLDGERGFSEIDALHSLARDIGAIERAGGRDTITWAGRVLLGDPLRLWRVAARTPTSTGGFFAAQCELVFASLLQQVDLDEDEAGNRLGRAVIEAAGGEDYLDRVDETGVPRGEAVVQLVAIGMQMTRTLGTALRMFDEAHRPAEARPWLNDVGRATAIESLRASLEAGEFVPTLGPPLEGAWN
ncbi:MAG TPA: hypothetical protein VE889_08290 [Actinomycetota bacterium]|nr:hypothetical protein [Actinomycetota bacterium]